MKHINIEIKAKSNKHEKIREFLKSHDADFKGIDHQIDTYFKVNKGRLKLREGNIENALIWYDRKNTADAKQSDIILYQHQPSKSLKDILTKVHGIKVVVDKKRKIYFIDNVKFHFDTVEGLGTFIEVEAIDSYGSIGIEKLKGQCKHYFDFFELHQVDYVNNSYSDLLLAKH